MQLFRILNSVQFSEAFRIAFPSPFDKCFVIHLRGQNTYYMNKIINGKEKIFSTLEEKLDSIIEKTERPDTSSQWMTSNEVEQYLGICKTTLRRYRSKGLIPFYKLNRKLLFLRFEVNKALLDSVASQNKSK